MDEEKAEWLLANNVMVCTSLDGPEDVHNFNRTWRTGTNAYEKVLYWIAYFNRRYIEMGRDPNLWHIDALMTTTSKSLDMWQEIVDLYIDLGIRSVHFRPLNPFGFATRTWHKIGYSGAEFNAVYDNVLDYVIQKNIDGVQVIEGTAATFLKKILTPDDPNFVDIRSPVGSGTGQIADLANQVGANTITITNAIQFLFNTAFSRPATTTELADAMLTVTTAPTTREGLEDVAAVLMSTTEFVMR